MISALQNIVSEPKNTFLLFDESQHGLFLESAMTLIQSGISVGAISSDIVKSLGLTVDKTTVKGIYTTEYSLSKPSILCFSSGTKTTKKELFGRLKAGKIALR